MKLRDTKPPTSPTQNSRIKLHIPIKIKQASPIRHKSPTLNHKLAHEAPNRRSSPPLIHTILLPGKVLPKSPNNKQHRKQTKNKSRNVKKQISFIGEAGIQKRTDQAQYVSDPKDHIPAVPKKKSKGSLLRHQQEKNPEQQPMIDLLCIIDQHDVECKPSVKEQAFKRMSNSFYCSKAQHNKVKKSLSPSGKLVRSKSGDHTLIKGLQNSKKSTMSGKQRKKKQSTHTKKNDSIQEPNHRRPNEKDTGKDFVLLDQKILAIKNSQQLEELLAEQSQQNRQHKNIKKRSLRTLERYMYGALQSIYYIRQQGEQAAILEKVMTRLKDMSFGDKLNIYSQLQKQLGKQGTHEQSSGPADQNVYRVPSEVPSLDLDSLTKIAIENVENKYSQAIAKLEAEGKRSSYHQKLSKLSEWRSRKFREIMAARNLIKSPRSLLQQVPDSDYVKKLNDVLQNQFDHLLHQNFQSPLEIKSLPSSETEQSPKVDTAAKAAQQKSQKDIDEQLQNNILEEIARAKYIKQTIKDTIDKRTGLQLSRFFIQHTRGIPTHLESIGQYLYRLTEFVLQRFQDIILTNIRKCYGFNVKSKLDLMRQGKFQEAPGQEELEILPSQIFVEFQQQVIGIGDTPSQKELKYFEHIHNKAIFDVVNSILNTFRPFYRLGEPLPWVYDSLFFSSFVITEQNVRDVLENVRFLVMGHAETLCGLIVEVDPSALPSNMSRNQIQFSRQLIKDLTEHNHNVKNNLTIQTEIAENLKHMSLGIYETKVLEQIADSMIQQLVDQFRSQLYFLSSKR